MDTMFSNLSKIGVIQLQERQKSIQEKMTAFETRHKVLEEIKRCFSNTIQAQVRGL
jgi:hypothetical protein